MDDPAEPGDNNGALSESHYSPDPMITEVSKSTFQEDFSDDEDLEVSGRSSTPELEDAQSGRSFGRSQPRVRGPWTKEEDDLLASLVAEFGAKKWSLIAERVPGRIGKQCRERWLNHLDNSVKKTPWTLEEDNILLETQKRIGNKWSEIARCLPGRPENAVKNRFNSLTNKGRTPPDGRSRSPVSIAETTSSRQLSPAGTVTMSHTLDRLSPKQQQTAMKREVAPVPRAPRPESAKVSSTSLDVPSVSSSATVTKPLDAATEPRQSPVEATKRGDMVLYAGRYHSFARLRPQRVMRESAMEVFVPLKKSLKPVLVRKQASATLLVTAQPVGKRLKL